MQSQTSQRKTLVCGSGVQRRSAAIDSRKSAPIKVNEERTRKTGGYVSAMALPKIPLPFSFDVSIFKIVLGGALCAVMLYLYMVVSIVVATVERKSLEEQVREESTELTYQETEYSKLLGSITLASARASGYIDANNSGFATRVDAPTLTLNNE